MNAEQAKAAADMLATVWEGEFPATCKVLAAVKDDNRGYKPDAEVAHGVGAGHASGHRRHLVHRQHHQRRVRVEPRCGQAGRVAVQERQRHRRVLQEDVSREARRRCARCRPRSSTRDARLLRHDEDAARRSSSASPTTTASIIAASSPLTCARWARRCRTSTARSADAEGQLVHGGTYRLMSFPDLRAFLDRLRRDGDLVTVDAGRSASRSRRDSSARRSRPADRRCSSPTSRAPTSGSSPICSARRGAPSWRSASGRCA